MGWRPAGGIVLAGALAALVAAPSPAGAQQACPPPPGTRPGYSNPLHTCPAADPGILRVGPTFYAYGTERNPTRGFSDGAMDIFRWDVDQRTWVRVGPVFPPNALPSRVLNAPRRFRGNAKLVSPSYWAPAAYPVAGRFLLYFSARNAKLGWNEIHAATAPGPEGPWRLVAKPVVANNRFSVIDPQLFYDAGSRGYYLLWKDDRSRRRRIVLQRLSSDGLRRAGRPRQLLRVTQRWEGRSVEAPTLIKRGPTYYLFFSGNLFERRKGGASPYAVGVARAGKLGGPYRKFRGNPILKSNRRFQAPGHQDVVDLGNDRWLIFYHAYPSFLPSTRYLMMDQLRWGRRDGWPRVHNGTPSN